jgi:predicted nucleic-acid-binding Zn-ribbon protein
MVENDEGDLNMIQELERFIPNTPLHCPKCGCTKHGVRYCSGRRKGCGTKGIEHLHVTCKKCKHTQIMATSDYHNQDTKNIKVKEDREPKDCIKVVVCIDLEKDRFFVTGSNKEGRQKAVAWLTKRLNRKHFWMVGKKLESANCFDKT